jgi:hypothetical protein
MVSLNKGIAKELRSKNRNRRRKKNLSFEKRLLGEYLTPAGLEFHDMSFLKWCDAFPSVVSPGSSEPKDLYIKDKPCLGNVFRPSYRHLAHGAVSALLVAASSAGGADDNHATALATVLVGGHICLVV